MIPEGKLRKFLTNLYLLRVAIALWLVILLFEPLARPTSLFEGLLVYETGPQVLWTCLTVFLAAANVMVFSNLVLFYGLIRVNGSKAPLAPPQPNNRRTIVVFFVCVIPPSFFMLSTDLYTFSQQSKTAALSPLALFGWSMAGFACAALAVILAKFLQVLFATPLPGQLGEPHFILPLGWIPVLGPWFERLYLREGLFSRLVKHSGFTWLGTASKWLRSGFAHFGEGYFAFTAEGQAGPALPGQGFAVWLAFVVFLTYEISGRGYLRRLTLPAFSANTWDAPTICHVLSAFLFLATLLSGLAFFVDRYRIPLTLVVTVVLALTAVPQLISGGDSDHTFDLSPGLQTGSQSTALATPREALLRRRRPRLIAVAAAGGGIQAAAWTTKVLSELVDQRNNGGNDFAGAVGVLSGVSGGSVGVLNYLTIYGTPVHSALLPPAIVPAAEHDSLQAISWGLVHPDFWRIVFPFAIPNTRDRGWALERTIAQASLTNHLLLSQLSARTGERPALLFNSTEAETGAPIVFPTTSFPPPKAAAGIDNFRRVYGQGADIPVSTAVRLSATFPWVSPAARSSFVVPSNFHYVDGGYYDTFGMVSLIEWLRAALLAQPGQPPAYNQEDVSEEIAAQQILILEINSFPPSGQPKAPPRPWPYQLVAPVLALYDVRDHSQQARNQFEYQLQSQSKLFHDRVFAVEFQYNPQDAACAGGTPLSWRLTPRERDCIDAAWNRSKGAEIDKSKACVAAFLSGQTPREILPLCQLPVEPDPPEYGARKAN